MKNILILFAILLSSCADTITTKNLSVTDTIPYVWKHSIPESSEVTGKWWEAFQDTILNKVFTEFNSNSPDLKSITSRIEMARQAYKINIAPRLPVASLGLTGSSREQNLTAFGLSEDFFGGGQNGDQSGGSGNGVTSFSSNSFGLNLSMQWEIDIWRKIFNQSKAALKDYESIS